MKKTEFEKFKCHKSHITKNNRLMSCHHIVRCWLCFLSSAISYHQHHPPPHSSSSSSSSSVNNVLISIMVCLLQLQCLFPDLLYAYACNAFTACIVSALFQVFSFFHSGSFRKRNCLPKNKKNTKKNF